MCADFDRAYRKCFDSSRDKKIRREIYFCVHSFVRSFIRCWDSIRVLDVCAWLIRSGVRLHAKQMIACKWTTLMYLRWFQLDIFIGHYMLNNWIWMLTLNCGNRIVSSTLDTLFVHAFCILNCSCFSSFIFQCFDFYFCFGAFTHSHTTQFHLKTLFHCSKFVLFLSKIYFIARN